MKVRSYVIGLLIIGFTFSLVPQFVSPVEAESATITWWYEQISPSDRKALKKHLITPFNQSHPNINVKLVVKGQNLPQQLRSALLAGAGPDLVMSPGPSWVLEYAKQEHLVPLDSYIEDAGLDDKIFPWALNVGKVNGKTYSLPITYEGMGIFYNKTLFKENGWEPPTNRKEFVQLAENIKSKGITPISEGNADWKGVNEYFPTVYFTQYAGPGNVYKALRGEKNWSDPEFTEAIEMLKSDWEKYYTHEMYYSLGWADFISLVATREAAMTIQGSWAFQWLGNDSYWPSDDQWGWAPMPSFSDRTDYPTISLGIGTTLSVNKDSEHPDKAAKFLTWIFKQHKKIGLLARDFPGQYNLPIDIPSSAYPEEVDPVFRNHLKTLAKASKAGNYGYTTWTFWPSKTEQYIIDELPRVLKGSLTPEDYQAEQQSRFSSEASEGSVPPIPPR